MEGKPMWMRLAAMLFMVMVITGPAAASQFMSWSIGIGQLSCGNWTLNPDNDFSAETWILGYWSGLNVGNTDHLVGHSTDAYGIIGEVKNECQKFPSEPLLQAVEDVYWKMSAASK